jgi:poly-gamma-glutamate capsule biosynthesis protein CapA/YwtB (metallophosphatase superfamily)
VIFSCGMASSGIPPSWAATPDQPGINFIRALSRSSASELACWVRATKQPGDVAVVSVHWGSNWGYSVSPDQIRFAHHLIDGGVDIVHGHSSHHPRPIEAYRDKLILHGCGDLINDYEASPAVPGRLSRVSGLGSRVSGLGSRVSGLGSRVTGRCGRIVA